MPPPVERVLQVHTRYRQPGGEDRLVEAERALLEAAGITVGQVMFDNSDLRESRSLAGDVRLATSAVWSIAAERRVRRALRQTGAQVLHVHNTFPAASPSVFAAARRAGIPVVHTVHNYRLVCPAATAFRDGRPCLDCLGRRIALPAVAHACVRGSRTQSAVAAATLGLHRALGTYTNTIGLHLALTSFQRSLLESGGLSGDRIRVVPNFLEPDPGEGQGPRSGVLYVGRLSPEKGIETLIEAARLEPGTISVAGDGPLRPLVEDAASAGLVRYLGRLGPAEVVAELQRAVAMLLPSLWFEGFPLVILEAFAAGTPVVASRIGSLAEIVAEGQTGLLVVPGDPGSLAGAIRLCLADARRMRHLGHEARATWVRRYSGGPHLAALLDAYQSVTRPRGGSRAGRRPDEGVG